MFTKTSSSEGWVELDAKLLQWAEFLNTPVVMSMFVVALSQFDFNSPRIADLPSSKGDVYSQGLQAIVAKKLANLADAGEEHQLLDRRLLSSALREIASKLMQRRVFALQDMQNVFEGEDTGASSSAC